MAKRVERGWKRNAHVAALVAAGGVVAAGWAACRDGDEPAVPAVETTKTTAALTVRRDGGFNGTFRALYPALGSHHLVVPDVEVWVENAGTGVRSASVTSDPLGRFYIPRQAGGFYRLCWRKAGFVAECRNSLYSVDGATQLLGNVSLRPLESPPTKLRGSIKLTDGSSCFHVDEFFGVEETARIEALSAAGSVISSARANHEDEFLLTQVPRDGFVRISCGGARDVRPVSRLDSALDGRVAISLPLKNRSPRLHALTAMQAGLPARGALPGETVDLGAKWTEPDDDNLTFTWKVAPTSGSLSSINTPATKWTLPLRPGTFFAYLTISDSKGGRSTRSVSVRVRSPGDDAVLFSGIVKSGNLPVADALIDVSRRQVKTDANGRFSVKVAEAQRYLITIEKRGFAEFSRHVLKPSRGEVFGLTRAHAQTFDPAVTTVIVDRRGEWLEGPKGRQANQRRRPAQVTIKGGSLVDRNGAAPDPARGPYTAYIATYDPTSETMLGDFGARNAAGKDVALVSLGAVFVEVRDATGAEYNLRPGSAAEIQIPVQDAILRSEPVPPTVLMWTYNLKTGQWEQLPGRGNLSATGAVVANVTGFSTKNADIEKANPSCVRLFREPEVPRDGSWWARFSITQAPGSVRAYDLPLDDQFNVLYNLPDGAPYVLEIYEGHPTEVTAKLKSTDSGDTGAPWGGVGLPPYPYDRCREHVVRAEPTAHSRFLSYKGFGSLIDANAYRDAIDPLPRKRATLGDFLHENGFDTAAPGDVVRTSFLNHNDLGFGRDMYCYTNPGNGNVACYVTNYGLPDQALGNADLAHAAVTADAVATVAMEYSPLPGGGDKVVKFYVYDGGEPTSPWRPDANLDRADNAGSGLKYLPNLCLTCHGGNVPGPDLKSSFREFDLRSFRYPGANPQSAQEANFKRQNAMVQASRPSFAISDLIERFYGGPTLPSATFDPNALPSGWVDNTDLYRDVVAESCRTCHVALPERQTDTAGNAVSSAIDWDSLSDFDGRKAFIGLLVCDAKAMPNANITFKNFWLSQTPRRSEVLGAYLGRACPP